MENLIEHMFLAECLQESWFGREEPLEVSRAEVDRGGYDVVLRSKGVTRYVQLKASRRDGRTNRQTVNARLQAMDGGCIVWILYEVDDVTRRAKMQFLWREASDLPERIGRHTRGERGPRPNMRVLTRGSFERLTSMSDLVDRLFGTEASAT